MRSEQTFRRTTAGLVVIWAMLCVAVAIASFLRLANHPSHRFMTTVLTGQYVVVAPDAVARRAGIQRGDRILSINEFSLSDEPLSHAPVLTDRPNVYTLKHPGGPVYATRLTHRELTWSQLLESPGTYLFLLCLAFPALYLAVGIGVYRARPDLRSSWALLLFSGFMAAYLSGVLNPGQRLQGGELFTVFNAALILVPGFHIMTMYPVELEAIRRRRALLALPYALGLGFFLLYAISFWSGRGVEISMRALVYWNLVVAAATCIYMTAARRRMETRDLRQRLDIAFLGYAVSVAPIGAVFLIQDVVQSPIPAHFAFAWFVCFPLAIGVGILRQRAYGIRDLAKSSFVYGVLTVGITATYALAVALIGTLYGSYRAGNPWFSFPVIFGLVLLFAPLRARLHRLADNLFERGGSHYQDTVRGISEALVSLLSLDEILERVIWAATGPMGTESGVILLLDPKRSVYRPAASRGGTPAELWTLSSHHPLVKLVWAHRAGLSRTELPMNVLPDVLERCRIVYQELGAELLVPLAFGIELRGIVAVGRKRTGDVFRPEDREMLATLVNQAAVAIENALAYEEIAHLNRTLEARIEARTRELRETQAALAQRENMASIGQLVAGVAHEINNPISFVHSNLHLIEEQIEGLLGAVDSGDPTQAAAARENVTRLVERSQEGTRRIREIVEALRTFSRVDQTGLAEADLLQGLETTLGLMSPRLGDVEIVRELQPLAPVHCHAGQINQVLMNLIVNACDAGAKRIVLRSAPERDWIRIEVEDDGSGIPLEVQRRIFEPFFTTKGVGEGTGLGLAITHGIVERHGGRIRLVRSSEKGTTFRIELPVKGPEAEVHS
jgi:signal transduction histidine kinase